MTHFSNYDCNDPISEPDIDADTGGEDGHGPGSQEDGQCNGAPGCFINYKSGTLHEWVDLPSVQILNEQIALKYATALTEHNLPKSLT
ncbi:MAG: hypothetical protein R2932_48525 [Caldilineaceae bacterium]